MKSLVWFKRDLRIDDHLPLANALRNGPTVALFVIEDDWLNSPEFDPQHLAFTLSALKHLRQALLGARVPFVISRGDVLNAFAQIRNVFAFEQLHSHEETGPGWTYQRDKDVAVWCKSNQVRWQETAQHGVVRRLEDRRGWAGNWQRRMDSSLVHIPAGIMGRNADSAANALQALTVNTLEETDLETIAASARPVPPASSTAANACLQSFLSYRGANYRQDISSPTSSEISCSRISAYLSFGLLSMKQVHQVTEARIGELLSTGDPEARRFAYHLRGFAGRLRWHCHFMQKLEDEPSIEFRNFARSADGLREDDFNREHFEAWKTGHTGFEMVDACMRSLNATGWLNFRMRALLVSAASYHLWLHWRETGQHLARQFLDFEAGIHWSQMQMQSGTTGINTLRIYSPSKQAQDQDPTGEFIRRWVPEYGTKAYAQPIVDEKEEMRKAKEKLYSIRSTAQARTEASAIQAKHGSRKSGLLQNGTRPARASKASRGTKENSEQGSLLD